MDEIKNRLNCIESGYFAESGTGASTDGTSTSASASTYSTGGAGSHSQLDLEQIKHELADDSDFVSGIVDNIMTNSNLSEIIEQIDTVQSENRELRDLLYAQQKTINEMNVMLLKIISQSLNQQMAPVMQTALALPTPDADADANANDANADDADADDANADDADADDADADADDADADADSNIQLVVIDAGSNMQSVD